jgi:hypothetical protein
VRLEAGDLNWGGCSHCCWLHDNACRPAPRKFKPRRGAGDGEEGRSGGEPDAEWPSCESAAQVRQLSRKARDVRFPGFKSNQLGERRCGGFRLLTAKRGAGRGDAVVDTTLSRTEFDSFVSFFRRHVFDGRAWRRRCRRGGHERSRQHTFP